MAEVVIPNAGGSSINAAIVVRASGTLKTTTFTSDTYTNMGGSGIHVTLDVTAKEASPTSLILTIYGIDPASGKAYALLTSAAVSTVSTNTYMVYPGSAVVSNVSANNILPKQFYVYIAASGADGTNYFTFSVGANVLR